MQGLKLDSRGVGYIGRWFKGRWFKGRWYMLDTGEYFECRKVGAPIIQVVFHV